MRHRKDHRRLGRKREHRQALGKDHPLYFEEFLNGLQSGERMGREGW